MIDDIKKSKGNYYHFVKECIRDLAKNRVCYVFNKDQIKELENRYKGKFRVEKNECGYTIYAKRNEENNKNKN